MHERAGHPAVVPLASLAMNEAASPAAAALDAGYPLEVFTATMVQQAVRLTCEQARDIVRTYYGIDAIAESLTGERDENFRVRSADGRQFVLKISSPLEDPLVSDLPTAAMLHVEKTDASFPCPRVHRDTLGRSSLRLESGAGEIRIVRMVTWLPGQMLDLAPRNAAQRAAIGGMAARLGQIMRDFHHPAARRPMLWDLRHTLQLRLVLDDILKYKPMFAAAAAMDDFLAKFEAAAAPGMARLRHQVVHNDFNFRNVLVDPQDPELVVGVIDFGDMSDTLLVADLAIAAHTQITQLSTMKQEVMDTVAAYHAVEPLLDEELAILNWLLAARGAMSILIPAWYHIRNPGNTHFNVRSEAEISRRIELINVLMATRFFI